MRMNYKCMMAYVQKFKYKGKINLFPDTKLESSNHCVPTIDERGNIYLVCILCQTNMCAT